MKVTLPAELGEWMDHVRGEYVLIENHLSRISATLDAIARHLIQESDQEQDAKAPDQGERSINDRIAWAKGWRHVPASTRRNRWTTAEDDMTDCFFSCPDFEHDIAAAWLLVEEIRIAGLDLLVLTSPMLDGDHGWYVRFEGPASEELGVISAHGATVEKAICLAWLEVNEDKAS